MGGEGPALTAALTFLVAVMIWVTVLSLLIFGSLKMCGLLRVAPEVEEEGMDSSEHGVTKGAAEAAGSYVKGATAQGGAAISPSG